MNSFHKSRNIHLILSPSIIVGTAFGGTVHCMVWSIFRLEYLDIFYPLEDGRQVTGNINKIKKTWSCIKKTCYKRMAHAKKIKNIGLEHLQSVLNFLDCCFFFHYICGIEVLHCKERLIKCFFFGGGGYDAAKWISIFAWGLLAPDTVQILTANTRHSTNVGWMLAHRLRRRPNIDPTLSRGQRRKRWSNIKTAVVPHVVFAETRQVCLMLVWCCASVVDGRQT